MTSGIDAVRDRTELHRYLRIRAGQPGLCREVLGAVLSAFGADAGRALILSGCRNQLLRFGDEPAVAHRIHGIHERIRGRWRSSAASFVSAGSLAVNPVEANSFQVGAVDSLARCGRLSEATSLGESIAGNLDRLGEQVLAARVRLNLGNAYEANGQLEQAAIYFRLATDSLPYGGYEHASALMGLSTALLYAGNAMEGRSCAEQARQEAIDQDLAFLSDLCEVNLAQADLVLGRADLSLDRLLRLRTSLEHSSIDAARLNEHLGDAYFALNLFEESIEAFDQSIHALGPGSAMARAHARVGKGLCLQQLDRKAEAKRELALAYRGFQRGGGNEWAIWSSAKVAGLEGDPLRARTVLRSALSLQPSWLMADALLTVLPIEYSESALDAAKDAIRSESFVGLEWKVWRQIASQLPTTPKRIAAFRRMFRSITDGRARTFSLTARMSYMRDKTVAIRDYLEVLLADGRPSYVREALEVIRQTRSVTLLDEILSASKMPETARQQLAELRSAVPQIDESRSSRSATVPQSARDRKKAWTELTRFATVENPASLPPIGEQTTVFAETHRRIHRISRNGRANHALTEAETGRVNQLLQWIRFELMEPLIERTCSAESVTNLLRELAYMLLPEPDSTGSLVRLCPDGLLWNVPWAACLGVHAKYSEAEILLHPGMFVGERQLRLEKVLLWAPEAKDLPFAHNEMEDVLRRFPATHICRTAAEARESLREDWDLIHVAAHAQHQPSNPMFSAICFGDESITAAEIARSESKIGLAILAACETGMLSGRQSEEPDGLVRAFLARGAGWVIGSAWLLDDEASQLLFHEFYRALQDGASLPKALHSGRAHVRTRFEHPYFWGAPTLFRGYHQ